MLGMPSAVQNLREAGFTDMSVTLEWDEPAELNGAMEYQYVVDSLLFENLIQTEIPQTLR